jgi:glycerol-3-phosphate dehydrogenase
VTIIGGGVVGFMVARALSACEGVRIRVCEAYGDIADGVSKANSGIVHGAMQERHGTVKAALALRGNRAFDQLEEDLAFGFRRSGALICAFNDEEAHMLPGIAANARANGVRDVQVITGDEAREREPALSPQCISALWAPSVGVCSPHELVIALAENAVTNGVEVVLGSRIVTSIREADSDGGRYRLVDELGRSFLTDYIINAAGHGAPQVAQLLGTPLDIKMAPRIGEYLVLSRDATQHLNLKHVLFPVPLPKIGKGLLVCPTVWNTVLLGPTSRDLTSTQELAKSREEIEQEILSKARRLVPALPGDEVIAWYSGVRPKAAHSDFTIRADGDDRRIINMIGIDSPGLTSSPAIAELVMSLLRAGGLSLEPRVDFNPRRRPIVAREKSPEVLRTLSVDETNPDRRIVCRCERITETEVRDGLSRLPRSLVPSTDAVKKRSRCGMGRCSGRFCEPRVAQLVAESYGVDVSQVVQRKRPRLSMNEKKLLSKL